MKEKIKSLAIASALSGAFAGISADTASAGQHLLDDEVLGKIHKHLNPQTINNLRRVNHRAGDVVGNFEANKKKWELTPDFLMIVGRFGNGFTNREYVNLMKLCKRNKELL